MRRFALLVLLAGCPRAEEAPRAVVGPEQIASLLGRVLETASLARLAPCTETAVPRPGLEAWPVVWRPNLSGYRADVRDARDLATVLDASKPAPERSQAAQRLEHDTLVLVLRDGRALLFLGPKPLCEVEDAGDTEQLERALAKATNGRVQHVAR